MHIDMEDVERRAVARFFETVAAASHGVVVDVELVPKNQVYRGCVMLDGERGHYLVMVSDVMHPDVMLEILGHELGHILLGGAAAVSPETVARSRAVAYGADSALVAAEVESTREYLASSPAAPVMERVCDEFGVYFRLTHWDDCAEVVRDAVNTVMEVMQDGNGG